MDRLAVRPRTARGSRCAPSHAGRKAIFKINFGDLESIILLISQQSVFYLEIIIWGLF